MGSATWAAALIVAVFAGLASSTEASLLPQIEAAREIHQTRETLGIEKSPPALRKHYVEVEPGDYVAVRGSRERRQVRFARLIEGLDGDRLEVFQREGFPTFRHQENFGGEVTTHWSYLKSGVTYIFRGDDLVRTVPY